MYTPHRLNIHFSILNTFQKAATSSLSIEPWVIDQDASGTCACDVCALDARYDGPAERVGAGEYLNQGGERACSTRSAFPIPTTRNRSHA